MSGLTRRDVLLTLGGPTLWAAWFVLAYGLHGYGCSRFAAVANTAFGTHQWLQVAAWLGTLMLHVVLVRLARTRARDSEATRGRHLALQGNVIGLASTLFTGVPVLLIPPC